MTLEQFEKGVNKRIEFFRLGLVRDFDKECEELLNIISVLDNLQESITGCKVSVKKFNNLGLWETSSAEKDIVYSTLKAEVKDRQGDLDKYANDFLMGFSVFIERLKHD